MIQKDKVYVAKIQREPGWLYYFDDSCIKRVSMIRRGMKRKPGDKPEIIVRTDVSREDGFIYFLDHQGDVSRCPASRGGRPRKKPKREIAKRTPATLPIVEQISRAQDLAVLKQMNLTIEGHMQLVEKKTKSGSYTCRIEGTNLFHKIDGPAELDSGGSSYWRQFGLPHRIGGPAVELSYGRKEYWVRGLRHNLEGPAIIESRYKSYYICGKNYTKPAFNKIIGNPELVKQIRAFMDESGAGFKTGETVVLGAPTSVAKSSSGSTLPLFAAGAMLAGAGVAWAKNRSAKKKAAVVKEQQHAKA